MVRHEVVAEQDHPRPEVVPVDQRLLGLERRSIRPALLVLVLALVMALGIPLVDAAVPGDTEIRAGDVVQVAGGVQFVPAVGWGLADGVRQGQAGTAGSYGPRATVTNGAVVLTVTTAPWPGSPTELLDRIRATDAAQAPDGPTIEDRVENVRTGSGAAGVVARYRGPTTDGLLAAIVVPGPAGPTGVEVQLVGPQDAPRDVAADAAAMIESIGPVPGGEQ